MSERLHIAWEGRIADLTDEDRARLFDRAPDDQPEVAARVAELMDEVRRRGDAALREMAERFDRVELDAIEVPRALWTEAADRMEPDLLDALERAATNLRAFHRALLPAPVEVESEPGVRLGRRFVPLQRVGVYAPGGRAAYPSSVLMGVVPARVAGVGEVVVCSPPGPEGVPPDAVLAAAAVGGADRVFALGGAGAVAAMAFGTETVPAVEAIVGPGNRWVTEAKSQVAGRVRIDSPAGPSEVLVIADASADPDRIAAELVCQAEHDPDAAVVLVALDEALLDPVRIALTRRVTVAPRREVVVEAFRAAGALLVADGVDEAVRFTDRYAPEHLAVFTEDAPAWKGRFGTAGTVFVGEPSSVAFGDYLTGANHVLPTGGRARSFSGLSTPDFMRSYTWQEISREAAERMADDLELLAEAEGLPAHAEAGRMRRKGSGDSPDAGDTR